MSKWIIDQWLWNQSVSTESEWKQRFIYSQLYSGTSTSDRALPKNDLFRALCLGSSGPVWCLWKGRANPQVNTSSMVLFISGACLVFRSWNIQKDFPVCVLPKPTASTSTAPLPQIPQHLLSDTGQHQPRHWLFSFFSRFALFFPHTSTRLIPGFLPLFSYSLGRMIIEPADEGGGWHWRGAWRYLTPTSSTLLEGGNM